jgi:hydrophobe/amphiphile efflux-3 (HAE3) family protein
MRQSRPVILRLLHFVHEHSLAVIIAFGVVTALFALAMTRIKVNPNLESLLPDDDEVIALMDRYGNGQVEENYLVIAVEAEDPLTLPGLGAFARAIEQLETFPEIKQGITPFNLISFKKDGSRLSLQTLSPGGRHPQTPEELAIFKQNLFAAPFAVNFVVSRDRTVLLAFFPTEATENYTELMGEIDSILADLKPYYITHVTGTIPFMNTTKTYLLRDLSTLLVLAGVVMLVIFYLGFRSKRAVVLPILVVGIGTVWCLGFMSLIGYNLTLMSVIIPPLVLALGSSYSIHILNQYYREAGQDSEDSRWIGGAIAHVNKTILLASVTTIAGLLSLLSVSMKQTREFAVSTSFGIFSCALLSLFFFPAVLYRLRAPKERQSKQVLKGTLTRGLTNLSAGVLRYRALILILLVAILSFSVFAFTKIEYNTDAISYFPERTRVIKDMHFFARKIGGFEEIGITLTAPDDRPNYFLRTDVLNSLSQFESRLAENPDICYLSSFVSYLEYANQVMYGTREIPQTRGLTLLLSRYFKVFAASEEASRVLGLLTNEDFSNVTMMLRIYDSADQTFIDEIGLRAVLENLDELQAEYIPDEVEIARWGSLLRYLPLSDILQRDALRSMVIAAALIICITAIGFRSLLYGLYAVIPLLTGIMINVVFLYLTGIPMDALTIMVSSIAIGVGVDDAIHFLIQFRKQWEKERAKETQDIRTAVTTTMNITGRPIVLTTLAIDGGLLILGFGLFKPIVYFGLLVIITLSAACLGTVLVLPAVLSIGRRRGRRRTANRTRSA